MGLAKVQAGFDTLYMQLFERGAWADFDLSVWQPQPRPLDFQAIGRFCYDLLAINQPMFAYFLALLGIMVIIWVLAENDDLELRTQPQPRPAPEDLPDNVHPIRSENEVDIALLAIREYWTGGAVPRIVVNAQHPGVKVPQAVKDRWQHQLVIDLDPKYPLRLELKVTGLWADLSFSGEVYRCFFAWESIYGVQNRDTGASQIFEDRVPKKLAS